MRSADGDSNADLNAKAAAAPQATRQQDRPARDPLADAALDAPQIPAVRRRLSGLAEALDAAAMRPRLAGLLGNGSRLHGCSVAERLYLPGAGCTVRYAIELGRAGPASAPDTLSPGAFCRPS